jgi:uncharacterized protein
MDEQVWYLPRDGYIRMPWRNGAGVTQEIMRVPAHGDAFTWRLSLATVAASGPFSAFPGYQRAVALVDGAGFRLDINSVRTEVLRVRGEHAVFAGAAEINCTLLDGPCTDLSLMVREPGAIASVSRLLIRNDVTVSAQSRMLQMLFVLQGQVTCRKLQSAAGQAAAASTAHSLNRNDTLIISGAGSSWSLSDPVRTGCEVLVMSFVPEVSEPTKPTADADSVQEERRIS